MNKKIVIIILFVILIFLIGGIYIFSNRSNEEINDINSKNNIENEESNDINSKSDIENKEQDIKGSENVSEQRSDLNQNTEVTSSNPNEGETTNTHIDDNTTKSSVVKEVSPGGFMGSSLYRVVLYSNNEVYVEKFDGSGYEDKNIISKELIAKNVNMIETAKDEEHYGEVFVKGGEAISTDFGWINFE